MCEFVSVFTMLLSSDAFGKLAQIYVRTRGVAKATVMRCCLLLRELFVCVCVCVWHCARVLTCCSVFLAKGSHDDKTA